VAALGRLRWLVGIVISGVAIYIGFVGVDWREVGSALEEANYGLLVAALPTLLVFIVMRAQRWRVLFPERQLSLLATFGALNIGYMAGAILPLQLGELARVYVLSEAEQIRTAHVFSTVIVERVLDVFALLGILAVLIPFVSLPRAAAVSALLTLAVFLVIALVLVLAVADQARAEAWLRRLSRVVPQRFRSSAVRWGESLLEGLSVLRNLRVLANAVVWTVASWMTSSLVVYLILRAFDLDVPFAAAPFLLIATTFGFFVPSSPGAIGVYHAISIRTLTTVFDVPHDAAASYALVAHAIYLIPPTLLGAGFFWLHHLSLRRLELLAETPIEDVLPLEPSITAEPPSS
jgi:uncharacterized protein (TIRG00374 family)